MALVLADGQLGSSSATVLSVGTGERVVTILLFNTNAVTQKVYLSVARAGGTERQFFQCELEQYETAQINGLVLDPSDVISGYATSASVVNYQISISQPYSVQMRDAKGATKQSSELSVTLPDESGYSSAEVKIIGLLEEIRDIGLSIK